MRVVHWVLYVLAALIFLAPAVYLVQVWPREAPPATTEVDCARVEATSDGYQVILPSGARYQLARSDVTGTDKRGAALALVRSQIASENASYMHSWALFWFLIAGNLRTDKCQGRAPLVGPRHVPTSPTDNVHHWAR